ncbi:MAG: fused MFS/spermidine synthase [Candidatus Micrarchaeia archaeon]|jgi:spermidine synthase
MFGLHQKLALTVFVTGAAVMVVEVLGSRVLAPYFGSSLITWTSIISVILASLSIGYYLGGKMADRRPALEGFAFTSFLAGAFIALIPLLSRLSEILWTAFGTLWGSLFASLLFFAVPSALLGIVSPYAVRLNTERMEEVGSSAGRLYALSTVGSIVGTLAAGFYLIPNFGVKAILLGTSAVLLLLPVLLLGRRIAPVAIAALAVVLAANIATGGGHEAGNIVLYEADSQYYHVKVVDVPASSSRFLYLDRQLASGMNMSDNGLLFAYTKHTVLAYELVKPDSVLFIGMGSGTEAMQLRKNFPDAKIEVAELDPLLTGISKEYFGFQEDEKMEVSTGDARNFVRNGKGKYDIIRIDVFTSQDSIPFHLTTREALGEIKARLRDDGLVVTNIISALEGPGSEFFRAEYSTYKEEFRNVEVLGIQPEKPETPQNIVLLASDGDYLNAGAIRKIGENRPELAAYAGHLVGEEKLAEAGGPVLSDDYAPVESMLAGLQR